MLFLYKKRLINWNELWITWKKFCNRLESPIYLFIKIRFTLPIVILKLTQWFYDMEQLYHSTNMYKYHKLYVFILFLFFFLGCLPGFYGNNCSQPCKYPYFGAGCQHMCICLEEECDFSIGCSSKWVCLMST